MSLDLDEIERFGDRNRHYPISWDDLRTLIAELRASRKALDEIATYTSFDDAGAAAKIARAALVNVRSEEGK